MVVNRADKLLRVGMRFYLKTECADGDMYLQSLRYCLSNMNYSIGVSYAQRKHGVYAVKTPSVDTAWCAPNRPPSAASPSVCRVASTPAYSR